MTEPNASLRDRIRSSSLRQRIRSSGLYWRIKLFLKRISGEEIWIHPEIDVPLSGGADYQYDPASLSERSVVYCFGVGDTIGFELALIEAHGMAVHAFDPTPYTLEWIETVDAPELLRFHPWAVAGEDGTLTLYPRQRRHGRRSDLMWTTDPDQADRERAIEVPAWSIPSLMRELGHDRIDLLKMDVEGAEYDSLAKMLDAEVFPDQLLVEFHHRFPGIGREKTLECLNRLRGAGYKVCWVSTTGREISLIRR
jgi:FkbM family methyltransferase